MLRVLLIIILTGISVKVPWCQNVMAGHLSKPRLIELDFLIGHWIASKEHTTGNQKYVDTLQMLSIRFFPDSSAIILEGYLLNDSNRKDPFLSIITYNSQKEAYEYYSLLYGKSNILPAELKSETFTWYAGNNLRSSFRPYSENSMNINMEAYKDETWEIIFSRALFRQ